LIWDEFDICSISTADDLHLLQITDAENQKFNVVITDLNVFLIWEIISHLIIAAVRKYFITNKTVKFLSIFKTVQSAQIKFTDVNDSDNLTKLKQKNYNKTQIMKIWYYHLTYLNAISIIRLSEDLKSDMLIKNSKVLFFYETCYLADMKKKISKILISCFKYHDKMFHINTDDDNQILDDSDDFISSFSDVKYFVLIICDAMCWCWIFFIEFKW